VRKILYITVYSLMFIRRSENKNKVTTPKREMLDTAKKRRKMLVTAKKDIS